VLYYVGFVRQVLQPHVGVKEFGVNRDTDGVFNSNIAAARGVAVY
jgi:hypothetical protein